MRYLKCFAVMMLAFGLGAVMVSPAAAQKALKVGYLDISKTFDEYEKTKEYDEKFEVIYKDYEAKRNEKIEKLQEEQGKLALLKDDEKGKVEQQIEVLRNEILQFDRAQQAELNKQRDEKVREILLEIEKVVSDFAKQEGYDYVLNDRVLIYGGPDYEVTEKILERLNSSYNAGQ